MIHVLDGDGADGAVEARLEVPGSRSEPDVPPGACCPRLVPPQRVRALRENRDKANVQIRIKCQIQNIQSEESNPVQKNLKSVFLISFCCEDVWRQILNNYPCIRRPSLSKV